MIALLWACATAAPVVGPEGYPTRPQLPQVPLRIGGHTLRAFVADEPDERSQGLMGVTDLGPDEGMVFVYPTAAPRHFWMKNTPTALSIAFCDAEGRILTLADMVPNDTTLTPSKESALYVVEAHQGWFARAGVGVGSQVVGLPAAATR